MKKWNLSNKYVGWGITAFIVLSAVLGVYYLMFHGSILIANVKRVFNILMPIMFGLVIAYLLAPVMDYFEIRLMIPLCEKIRIKKGRRRDGFVRIFCIIITLTLFFTLLYSLLSCHFILSYCCTFFSFCSFVPFFSFSICLTFLFNYCIALIIFTCLVLSII